VRPSHVDLFLEGQLAEKVVLAEVDAVVAQDGVKCGRVKIEIRDGMLEQELFP
jgi:hypothetical protein